MTEIITHYVVVSDDAPEEAVREAVRIKAKMLEADTNLHDIRVVRESELRQGKILNQTGGRTMTKNTTDLREAIAKIMTDYGVDFYEGNLMHRTEQRLALIKEFQDQILALISNREKLAYRNGYAAGNAKKNYRKKVDGETLEQLKTEITADVLAMLRKAEL